MKKAAVALLLLSVIGCSSTRTATMSYQGLNTYVPNCNQPVQQLAFLRQQYNATSNNDQKAIIKVSIDYINTWCPESRLVRPQGCVTAREDFDVGSSQALVCRMGPNVRTPIVNRWETDIDN